MRKWVYACAIWYVCLCGCSSVRQETVSSETSLVSVPVTATAQYALLPTTALEKQVAADYTLTMRLGAKTITTDCRIVADDTKLQVVLLSETGTPTGELYYNNQLVVSTADLPFDAPDAESIIADMQFCFYRSDAVQSSLAPKGLQMIVNTANKATETRSMLYGAEEIMHIEKSAGQIVGTHFLHNYSYTLQIK